MIFEEGCEAFVLFFVETNRIWAKDFARNVGF